MKILEVYTKESQLRVAYGLLLTEIRRSYIYNIYNKIYSVFLLFFLKRDSKLRRAMYWEKKCSCCAFKIDNKIDKINSQLL
jgi:hypothetical protein